MATVYSFRSRAETGLRAAVFAGATLLLSPPAAHAQLGRQLETGLLSWTPSVALRDAGTDSNVYVEPGAGRSDRMLTFTPSVTSKLATRRLQVQADGQLDFIYFERFVQERSTNRKVNGRVQIDVGRVSPFVTGLDERARERQGEVDLRVFRRTRGFGVGVAFGVTAKGTVEVGLIRSRTRYDSGQIFREIDIAASLSRRSESLTGGFRYALTGLTTISLDLSRVQELYFSDANRNTADQRISATVFFAPDAVIRGRMTFGYHRLRANVPVGIPFRGFLADANIGYTFRESSRFNLRYARDTSASFDSPYNLNTQYGVDLVQDITGPLKATAAVSRSTIRHSENLFLNQIRRNERYDSYALGLQLLWSTSVKSTLAYEVSSRRSTIPIENYRRKRIVGSVSLVL